MIQDIQEIVLLEAVNVNVRNLSEVRQIALRVRTDITIILSASLVIVLPTEPSKFKITVSTQRLFQKAKVFIKSTQGSSLQGCYSAFASLTQAFFILNLIDCFYQGLMNFFPLHTTLWKILKFTLAISLYVNYAVSCIPDPIPHVLNESKFLFFHTALTQ